MKVNRGLKIMYRLKLDNSKYEIIGEINHFSEYVTTGTYLDILISQQIMYLS